MKKSKAASITVKMIVAWKPTGQFSVMLAREPQLAAKLSRQSKIKPKKKATIKPTVTVMNTSESFWKLPQMKMRR